MASDSPSLFAEYQGIWAIEYERKVDSTLETLMAGTKRSIDKLTVAIAQTWRQP